MLRRINIKLSKILLITIIFATIIFYYSYFYNDLLFYQQQNGKSYFTIRKPGIFLIENNSIGNYCNFKYGLPDELVFDDKDLSYSPELGVKSPYRVLYNVIEGIDNDLPAVTYSTHVTVEFIDYISEIVRLWDGPVSVAIYVPDFDANLSVRQLNTLCSCLPQMTKVSIHFVFPIKWPPYVQNNPFNISDSNRCKLIDNSDINSFRQDAGLIYPINVCRNVARLASTTKYLLVSDVQLMPNKGLAEKFLKMLKYWHDRNALMKFVYVIPLFEVDETIDIPKNKKELVEQLQDEKAVYFHRFVCSHCQKFPGIHAWMEMDPGSNVRAFMSVKREYPFHRWEPIYIGTNNEPLYSESLSWEGLQDKMPQMLEMCLIGYKFMVLDGAFLVHWPGIKRRNSNKSSWRSSFQKINSKYYKKIVENLLKKYKNNPKCKIQ